MSDSSPHYASAEKSINKIIATDAPRAPKLSGRKAPGTALPKDFKTRPYTVIVGRGKDVRQSIGNKRVRVLASMRLLEYSLAVEKRAKSAIVNKVLLAVKEAGGNFIKYNQKESRYYEVDDAIAREKIGYVFRDLLSDQYKSSSKSKVAKRNSDLFQRANDKLKRAIAQSFPTKMTTSIRRIPEAVASLEIPPTNAREMDPMPMVFSDESERRPTFPAHAARLCKAFSDILDEQELLNSPIEDAPPNT